MSTVWHDYCIVVRFTVSKYVMSTSVLGHPPAGSWRSFMRTSSLNLPMCLPRRPTTAWSTPAPSADGLPGGAETSSVFLLLSPVMVLVLRLWRPAGPPWCSCPRLSSNGRWWSPSPFLLQIFSWAAAATFWNPEPWPGDLSSCCLVTPDVLFRFDGSSVYFLSGDNRLKWKPF